MPTSPPENNNHTLTMLKNISSTLTREVGANRYQLGDKLISDEIRKYFEWIGFSVLCQFIDVFGTVTNIMNIVCFIKMGFKDSVNVSLLGLAVSDLFCVASLIWTNICYNPAFNELDLPFIPRQLQYITTGWLHVIFSRITSWMTAFITLERCLCITAPLKVRSIFTPKRVAIIIGCLYLVLLISATPVYCVNKLGMVFFASRNKSVLALVSTTRRHEIERTSFAVNNVAVPFIAFLVIIVCTIILAIKLQNQTKWRQNSATGLQSDKVSNRDKKVVKMVVVISTLFIGCFIPVSISFIAMSVVPEFSVNGKYMNAKIIFVGICLILESANSAANIFIYYCMSSRYKEVFREMFCIKRREKA